MSLRLLAYRPGCALARRFPRAARVFAWAVGWAVWRTQRGTRRRVIRNLLPACEGDRNRARRASLDVFRNVAAYYVEMALLPTIDPATCEAQALDVVHPERVQAFEGRERLIAVSAHAGNVELAIQALVGRRPFVAIVEPLEDRAFAEHMMALRASPGGTFIEGKPERMLAALRELHRGSILGLMGDRDLRGDGLCVQVFGRRARLPRGPWDIARRTESAILPAFCARLPGGRMRVVLEEPYRVAVTDNTERDVHEAAARWAKLFERHIRSDPGQWVVLEDFWANHGCDAASVYTTNCG